MHLILKSPNMELKEKISNWKKFLNYNENKKKYNYEELKITAMEGESNNKEKEIINLDVKRTFFDKEKKENQERISNILKTVFEIVPELKYNQGMNYVAAFLLNLTENEEESFYLLLGLFTSTKYGELFKNDLEQLKKFFYIFERLISIFLPELYIYFLYNKIEVNYFISSWFITLFTNSYNHNKNKDNPKILLRIFDSFLFYDWKAIMIIGISLLKIYEPDIFSLSTSEEILQFIKNDVVKANFFENENIDGFTDLILNYDIDEQLIKNIEEEIDIKRKMPNKGKNMSFHII